MIAPWVTEELKSVALKDERLNDRLREVLGQFAAHPTASIPAACGGRAEMEAAYRLFDNDKLTWDGILQPHARATHQRIALQRIVLLAQDTTEIDLTRPQQQVRGAGPLDGGSRRGALLHLLHAFTPDGTPLGTVHSTVWTREAGDAPCNSQSRAQRVAIPIEQKESYRWVVALQHANAAAQQHPQTQIICVADSEADIYEVLAAGAGEACQAEWIVRAAQVRALVSTSAEEATLHVREFLLLQPLMFTQTLSVRGRRGPKVSCRKNVRQQPQTSRETEVEIRVARVTLRPPWRPQDRKLPAVSVNVVLVREPHPPAGETPVEWLLLTSLPIDNLAQVLQVIQFYTTRWMVEVLFRTLKTGCRVEERRFEEIDRQLRCLAVFLIVAWRTLFVCRLGRSAPDVSCETVFEPSEWKAVYRVVQQVAPPTKPPPLSEIVWMVAQLGGYVNRGRHAAPGPQTTWLGLQRMHDLALCWDLFGPETRAGP